MRRRPVVLASAAAALLTALPLGWYFGSPWWTLWRMREAARAGDMKTFASYVDAASLEAQAEADARSWWRSVLAHPLRADPEGAAHWIARARQQLVEIGAKPQIRLGDLQGWLSAVPVQWRGIGPSSTGPMSPYIIHHGLDTFEMRYREAGWETGLFSPSGARGSGGSWLARGGGSNRRERECGSDGGSQLRTREALSRGCRARDAFATNGKPVVPCPTFRSKMNVVESITE